MHKVTDEVKKYLPTLLPEGTGSIFLPLCGQSSDLRWYVVHLCTLLVLRRTIGHGKQIIGWYHRAHNQTVFEQYNSKDVGLSLNSLPLLLVLLTLSLEFLYYSLKNCDLQKLGQARTLNNSLIMHDL